MITEGANKQGWSFEKQIDLKQYVGGFVRAFNLESSSQGFSNLPFKSGTTDRYLYLHFRSGRWTLTAIKIIKKFLLRLTVLFLGLTAMN